MESLLQILELKDEKRTGWQLRGVENPESVADHSWGTTLLTFLYSNREDVDKGRAIRIALVHDLGEVETGDIPKRAEDVEPETTEEEKSELERKTMEKFSDKLGENLLELWEEYEERETREAKFVKDMDMIEMCLQALKYEKEDRYDKEEENENFETYDNLDEFFATTEPRLNTDTGRQLFEDIKQRYEQAKG